ncbi:hypothetical protein RIR_jg12211.t1 [Rhizophagus irregularis DAOM 181602=DAOM 197198]|nr:hypothetical protein RIR_jg12211.t1 [Rhizophagus irregularis DAOM 181602=DAOM 197198]
MGRCRRCPTVVTYRCIIAAGQNIMAPYNKKFYAYKKILIIVMVIISYWLDPWLEVIQRYLYLTSCYFLPIVRIQPYDFKILHTLATEETH